jgi:4-amino-4-deoxy-L-arabinose transferase-like glycosyltransferase
MLPRLLNLDTFIGPDELAELGRDNNFALALAAGDWAGTLVGDGKPSVTLMWVNTIGVTVKWAWLQLSGRPQSFTEVVAPERPFTVWPERRLFLALASGLQILAAWPLLRLVWDEQIATVAVGLMALEPFLLAFTRMIRGDSLLAGFMILSLLGALAFLKSGRWAYNWFSGAMAGLALLTKLSAGAIVLTIVLLYTIADLSSPRPRIEPGDQTSPPRRRWFIKAIIGWGLATALIFFGLWPAWWFRPVETFNLLSGKLAFHAVEAANQQAALYFWGTVHPFGPGPWFYPVLAALRLTPWLLLGSLMATGRWLWQAVRQQTMPDLNVLGLLLYIGAYWLAMTLPGQKLDRFFMPIVPALAILTAIEMINAGRWLLHASRLTPHASRFTLHASHLTRLVLALIGLGLIWHISLYHPLYSTYFNPLSGNPQFWQWALPVGHGEGVNTALQSLSTLPDAATKKVVCGTNFPRCQPFFAGELWPQEDLRSARWFKADYVLWHIDEQQLGVFPDGVLTYLRRQPPLYIAHYHGLDYTWLYPVPRPTFLASDAKLEGVATLFGYEAEGKVLSGLTPGDKLRLHVYWQNEGQAHQQRFWWRVVDAQNYVWSEAMTEPLPGFARNASQKGAVVEGQVVLPLPPDLPPGSYTLRAGFANASGDVGQFVLPPAGSTLTVAGPPVGPTQPAHILDSLTLPDLRLRGYNLAPMDATPGERVWLTLYWQAVGSIQQDYEVTIRLLDPTGQPVEVWSGQPVYGTYPTSHWPAGAHVRDPRPLSLPTDLAPGPYRLTLNWAAAGQAGINLSLINIVERKVIFDAPPMQFQANTVFGDVATLLGYDLAGELSPEGAHVMVTLYWQAQRNTFQPYQVKLRLVDGSNGSLLAEQTAEPAQGTAPSTEWQAGEIVTDRHELVISSSQPTSVNLEIQLLTNSLQQVLLADGRQAFVVTEVQQKVSWRTQ